ncbi:MAG: BACON domain-containing protein [Candidatus Binatia bacterium]
MARGDSAWWGRQSALVLGGLVLLARAAASAQTTIGETPLVHDIDSFALAEPKIFWHRAGPCRPALGVGTTAGVVELPSTLARIATYGSRPRPLFLGQGDDGSCTPDTVRSEIVADRRFVYWVDDRGLVRLHTGANPGDVPEVLTDAVQRSDDLAPVELAQDGEAIYALRRAAGDAAEIWQVSKTSGEPVRLLPPLAAISDLSADGEWIYFRQRDELVRFNVLRGGEVETLLGGVVSYTAEQTAEACEADCPTARYVFIATEDRRLVRFDKRSGDLSPPLYDDSQGRGALGGLTSDLHHVFFFHSVTNPDDTVDNVLYRLDRDGRALHPLLTEEAAADTPAQVHSTQTSIEGTGRFVLWTDAAGTLQRIPTLPEELEITNLRLTHLEITQGVQTDGNSVRLVQGKRTFVRAFVSSDGDARPGVTAELYGEWPDGAGGPLAPLNPSGTITVQSSPSRDNLDDAFLFELPHAWMVDDLQLHAVLNPNHVPFEPTYADNDGSAIVRTFRPSPRLVTQIVNFGYLYDNKTYFNRYVEDVLQTFSWIRRVYPLASAPGDLTDPSPGFRPNVWTVLDGALGERVNRSAPECAVLYCPIPPPAPTPAPVKGDISLCASYYTNNLMQMVRAEEGIDPGRFFYGMISDELKFPRGQAFGGNVSSGPTGAPGGGSLWDTDGSYADWYAGHEIGHTLGRGHPGDTAVGSAGSCTLQASGECTGGTCGHDGADPDYPYDDAQISGADSIVYGFDAGDPSFGIDRAVYPGAQWTDLMSYCGNQWISDYTYEAMYDYLIAHPPADANATTGAARGRIAGDWLSLFGVIAPDAGAAHIHFVRRSSSLVALPLRVPGPYTVELLDARRVRLAAHPFTPDDIPDERSSAALSFALTVPFAPGTAEVRILDAAGRVLAGERISRAAPSIDALRLQHGGEPVTGALVLQWDGHDPDGDNLTYDVFYSADGGQTTQPLLLNIHGAQAEIDTDELGGGRNAILRVVVSDGAQTARAVSAPFAVAEKAPRPRIVAPADATRLRWGQMVTLIGEGLDLQDGSVAGGGLEWRNQHGVLGRGAILNVEALPVGTNQITLTATNRASLTASAQVSVIVGDELDLPGATLSVGPTRLAFHVDSSPQRPRKAELSITNRGGGSLAWQGRSDAAWLSVSPESGSAPAALTVSADPRGVADGTVLSGRVVIVGGDADGPQAQTIVIPVSLAVGYTFAAPPVAPPCTGDCNADERVSVGELITGVNIALGNRALADCAPFDANADLRLGISELIQAVNSALNGCA